MRLKDANRIAAQTLGDEKHFQHALPPGPMRDMLLRRFGFDVWQMPICGHCERIAYWDKDETGTPRATCRYCGGHTVHPLTVQQYYEARYHTDATLNPDAPMYADRQKVLHRRKLATVYGGEADQPDAHRPHLVIARN